MSSTRPRAILAATALAFVLAGGALALCAVALRNYRAAQKLLAPEPPSPLLRHPERAGIATLQPVSFRTLDGRMAGWYVPSRNRAAIVITHGTNADRSTMLAEIRELACTGFGVLAFDWPGLGESEGTILWDAGARAALTAAVDWLAARNDVDPKKIGGLGFSIGGFVMTQVGAGDPRLRALVLEGTPPDMDEYRHFNNGHWGLVGVAPARWALRHSGLVAAAWAPIRLVDKISPRSILVIGGSNDREIPLYMVRAFYAAAHQPKALWIVPGAEHGGYAQAAPAEYGRRLVTFFSETLTPTPEASTSQALCDAPHS